VLKQSLADLKGRKLTSAIISLHFLRPDVAVVDGKADIAAPDGTTDSGRYTSTWTKTGDKWLLSSVRDLPDSPAAAAPPPRPPPRRSSSLSGWSATGPARTRRSRYISPAAGRLTRVFCCWSTPSKARTARTWPWPSTSAGTRWKT